MSDGGRTAEANVANTDEVAQELARLDATRRRVLNVVGHGLRTPVTTMAGLVDVLERTGADRVTDELIAALSRTTRSIERLLDDLLLVSEVTTVVPVDEPRDLEVHDELAATWERLRTAGHVGERDELDVDGTATVWARPTGLRRALWHVLDNAAAYGGRPVNVRLERTDPVTVSVASPAEAPTPDDLDQCFELFYRSEAAVMTAPGLGIGLPVSRQLLELDGGTIDLERGDDGGVLAVLRLPPP